MTRLLSGVYPLFSTHFRVKKIKEVEAEEGGGGVVGLCAGAGGQNELSLVRLT